MAPSEAPRDVPSPRPRGVTSALVGAVVVLVGAWWVLVASYRSTFAIFGRDQGIFQYVAWAMEQGERAYVDFREINGPLIQIVHLAFMRLGGADEHVFRCVDMAVNAGVFALVGASVVGIGRDASSPRPRAHERLVWAAAGVVVLGAQYLLHGWWQTAQRESIYNWFLLVAAAAQLSAEAPCSFAPSVRARTWLMGIAGFSIALTWYGKPTCVLYTVLAVLALVASTDAAIPRRRALFAHAGGALVASAIMLAILVRTGDLLRCVQIIGLEVPRLYRYIWKLSFADAYVIWNNAPKLNYAFATLGVVLVLVATRVLPRRFLVLLVPLVGGLVNFFVQGKGFPYHLHPVTAGTHLVWLAAAAWAADRAEIRATWIARAAAAIGALALGAQCHVEASLSEPAAHRWDLAGATRELRAGEAYFREFPWWDFFAWDMRRAAAFVDEHTSPSDRIQTYGMDPYVLFLARRLSATPFMYSFELNVDSALAGGSGGRPDAREREWLLRLAEEHETEWLAALEKRPPAAFVLINRPPFSYPPDAEADLDAHCKRVSAWMRARFHRAAQFGEVLVWLPNGGA